jgi:hypothetical protein
MHRRKYEAFDFDTKIVQGPSVKNLADDRQFNFFLQPGTARGSKFQRPAFLVGHGIQHGTELISLLSHSRPFCSSETSIALASLLKPQYNSRM